MGDSYSEWFLALQEKKAQWQALKQQRFDCPVLFDEMWKRDVLTQPAAIKTACDFADEHNYIKDDLGLIINKLKKIVYFFLIKNIYIVLKINRRVYLWAISIYIRILQKGLKVTYT